MLQFDYLDTDRTKLTMDGKTPCIELGKGFSESQFLTKLGTNGNLKGKAYEDYQRLKAQRKDMN